MKYNLSRIMTKAWELFRKMEITFSEALHRAWMSEKSKAENERRVAAAKVEAGIAEETECKTWKSWKDAGFEVIHGSKALFNAVLIWASKGDGKTYKASFFSSDQVQPIAA